MKVNLRKNAQLNSSKLTKGTNSHNELNSASIERPQLSQDVVGIRQIDLAARRIMRPTQTLSNDSGSRQCITITSPNERDRRNMGRTSAEYVRSKIMRSSADRLRRSRNRSQHSHSTNRQKRSLSNEQAKRIFRNVTSSVVGCSKEGGDRTTQGAPQGTMGSIESRVSQNSQEYQRGAIQRESGADIKAQAAAQSKSSTAKIHESQSKQDQTIKSSHQVLAAESNIEESLFDKNENNQLKPLNQSIGSDKIKLGGVLSDEKLSMEPNTMRDQSTNQYKDINQHSKEYEVGVSSRVLTREPLTKQPSVSIKPSLKDSSKISTKQKSSSRPSDRIKLQPYQNTATYNDRDLKTRSHTFKVMNKIKTDSFNTSARESSTKPQMNSSMDATASGFQKLYHDNNYMQKWEKFQDTDVYRDKGEQIVANLPPGHRFDEKRASTAGENTRKGRGKYLVNARAFDAEASYNSATKPSYGDQQARQQQNQHEYNKQFGGYGQTRSQSQLGNRGSIPSHMQGSYMSSQLTNNSRFVSKRSERFNIGGRAGSPSSVFGQFSKLSVLQRNLLRSSVSPQQQIKQLYRGINAQKLRQNYELQNYLEEQLRQIDHTLDKHEAHMFRLRELNSIQRYKLRQQQQHEDQVLDQYHEKFRKERMRLSIEQEKGQQQFQRDYERDTVRSNERLSKLKKDQSMRTHMNKSATLHQEATAKRKQSIQDKVDERGERLKQKDDEKTDYVRVLKNQQSKRAQERLNSKEQNINAALQRHKASFATVQNKFENKLEKTFSRLHQSQENRNKQNKERSQLLQRKFNEEPVERAQGNYDLQQEARHAYFAHKFSMKITNHSNQWAKLQFQNAQRRLETLEDKRIKQIELEQKQEQMELEKAVHHAKLEAKREVISQQRVLISNLQKEQGGLSKQHRDERKLISDTIGELTYSTKDQAKARGVLTSMLGRLQEESQNLESKVIDDQQDQAIEEEEFLEEQSKLEAEKSQLAASTVSKSRREQQFDSSPQPIRLQAPEPVARQPQMVIQSVKNDVMAGILEEAEAAEEAVPQNQTLDATVADRPASKPADEEIPEPVHQEKNFMSFENEDPNDSVMRELMSRSGAMERRLLSQQAKKRNVQPIMQSLQTKQFPHGAYSMGVQSNLQNRRITHTSFVLRNNRKTRSKVPSYDLLIELLKDDNAVNPRKKKRPTNLPFGPRQRYRDIQMGYASPGPNGDTGSSMEPRSVAQRVGLKFAKPPRKRVRDDVVGSLAAHD